MQFYIPFLAKILTLAVILRFPTPYSRRAPASTFSPFNCTVSAQSVFFAVRILLNKASNSSPALDFAITTT